MVLRMMALTAWLAPAANLANGGEGDSRADRTHFLGRGQPAVADRPDVQDVFGVDRQQRRGRREKCGKEGEKNAREDDGLASGEAPPLTDGLQADRA
jgi:hypothetical protein